MPFFIIWTERNRRTFENEVLSDHRLKVLFMCSLYSWSKLFIGDRSMFFFYFIDWLDLA